MKPTTAVIMAAGVGSRMLPVTSAVSKELLPIGTRPIIDYIVADMVAAGIERIIFVIRPGQTGLKDYYLGNPQLDASLIRLGKTSAIAQLVKIRRQALFNFIEQPGSAGYGSAIPLRLTLDMLSPDEPVLISSSDDAVWHSDGTSETKRFIESYLSSGADGAIMALKKNIPGSRYAVIKTITRTGNQYLESITENVKQLAGSPSLANISKYILNGELREGVKTVASRPENAEYYITDAIVNSAAKHPVIIHEVTGTYLDAGNPSSWLEANNIVATDTKAKNTDIEI
jgi:UTP--glucose-1-phosphate uridylyltransferase